MNIHEFLVTKKLLPDNTIDFQYNTFRIVGLNVCGLRSKLNYGILNNYITTTDIMGLTEVKCNAFQITKIDYFNTIFMPAKHRQHQFGGVYGICVFIKKNIQILFMK